MGVPKEEKRTEKIFRDNDRKVPNFDKKTLIYTYKKVNKLQIELNKEIHP